ncbi:uncharacterized protein LOC126756011 [Bactrocera neohumeralis]|uniref:uncharacterized protein LOC126756011 n=1 Tax=Bactrocera neohumeralis TaxID=98809 RepID=UPI002165D752|nr:uncharacterized protein LOC126756011 [Bactrocera neohumeralis]
MAEWSNHKYFVALLLLIGVVCTKADGNENPKIDMEILVSRNRLLESMINESLKLTEYIFERSADLCKKMHEEDIGEYETSNESVNRESEETEVAETHETALKHCIGHIDDRLDPTYSGSSNRVENVLLHKYGFEDIQKVVNRKYDAFFVEILRQIDEYLKGLTPEQQSGTTAQNLRGWSSKIREAATLAQKEMAFRRCMRFYLFERGV